MSGLLLTICARGGSKGVKNKNIRLLNGKPLIYYSIKQALRWGKADHVVVSTDSLEIAKIAEQSGAEVPFMRPGELATDTCPTIPVLRHALKTCQEIYCKTYDYLMDLAVTAPIRKIDDLEKAFQLFLEKKPKTLFSVVPAHRNPYFNIVEEGPDGKVYCSKQKGTILRRQDAPPVYDMNASIYIYHRDYLLNEKNIKAISDHSIAYVMDEISAFDIDKEIDFKILELLAKESIISFEDETYNLNKSYLAKFSLKGKTAFVTGGVGLLGSEITKALAESGARVIILDIDEDKGNMLKDQLEKMSLNVSFEKFDVTDLNNLDKSIEKLAKTYQTIDVWINAAYPRTQDWGDKVEDLKLTSWQKNVDMHLNSYSWISRKVCLLMKKQKGGSLINFSSIYGVVGNDFSIYKGTGMTSPMAYAAIKGGIVNLSRYLASYFGKYGVRVNAICPGGVFNNQNKKFVDNYSQKSPLPRLAQPEEITGAVLFLASDASSYVTGSTLMVDGGWTAI